MDRSADESNKTVLKSIVEDGFTPTMENILKEEEKYLVFLTEISRLRSELDPSYGGGQDNKTVSKDDFIKIFFMTKELHDMHRHGLIICKIIFSRHTKNILWYKLKN